MQSKKWWCALFGKSTMAVAIETIPRATIVIEPHPLLLQAAIYAPTKPKSIMPVTAEELTRFKAHRWQISCLQFNHDGSRLASGGWDKEVHIWDLENLEIVHTLKGTRAPVTCVSWYRPNGGILCTGSADQTASLWNSETGSRVATLKEHFGWVLGSCFSTSGSHLATASWDKTVRIWDAGTATLINNLNGHTRGVWSVDFHPKSSMLCSASQDGSVIIWDARSNRPVRSMSCGHTDAVYSAKWSADGAMIASGAADTNICIWEPSQGTVINTIYGHTDTVKSVAFNPNTENVALPILASAGDFTMRLSDPRPTQKADILSCSLHSPGKEVEAVSISPDGSLLVTGGRDGVMILMNLQIPSVVPRTNTKPTLSATVRKSFEVLEESLKEPNPSEETFNTVEDLSKSTVTEAENVPVSFHDQPKSKIQRSSNSMENKSTHTDIGRVVLRRLSRSHEHRMMKKVVDIPTMVAHLSARASFIAEPSSSSSESSDSDLEDDKEGNFQVNGQMETVLEVAESTEQLTDKIQGQLLNERVNLFEKEERDSSSVYDDGMDSVVLLMKNFLDDNKPDEVICATIDGKSHETGQVSSLPAIPGEPRQSLRGDLMMKNLYDRESFPAQFSFSLQHPNSGIGIGEEQIPSSPDVHLPDNAPPHISSVQDKRMVSVRDANTRKLLSRNSTNQSNEYGDEVPLSMI